MVVFLILIGLPACIRFEFPEKWEFYYRLYPHMVFFTGFLMWGSLFYLYRAYAYLTPNGKQQLRNSILIAIFIAIIALLFEINAPGMMLFELKDEAKIVRRISDAEKSEIEQIPTRIFESSNIENSNITIQKKDVERAIEEVFYQQWQPNEQQRQGYYKFVSLSLSPETWKNQENIFSYSRLFYGLSYFITIFTVVVVCIFWRLTDKTVKILKLKYIHALVASQIIFFLWIPIRLYYLFEVKFLLGLQNTTSEIPVVMMLTIILIATLRKTWITENRWILPSLVIFLLFILYYVGLFRRELIDFTFGSKSEPHYWVAASILEFLFIYTFYVSEK